MRGLWKTLEVKGGRWKGSDAASMGGTEVTSRHNFVKSGFTHCTTHTMTCLMNRVRAIIALNAVCVSHSTLL